VPFLHGKNSTVLWNGADLSGYLDNTDFSADVDTGETTTYGKGWKTFIAGTAGATVGFTGKYDATAGLAIEGQLGTDSGVLTYSPNGAAIGDRARLVSVTASTYSESSPVSDVVAFGWDVLSESSVGFGWMLHPHGTDTNTTTGAERDDAAATTTGWTAHLHVTAVSGGSWVIKLQDAAVTNTYSDVTSGAFAAATGATSERLASASGATLRRYVRYVATRTGGTAGDTITFALAYARSV
jgi:hypothetical protein